MARLFKKKITFLISGGGSNLLKILEKNLKRKKFQTQSIISNKSISLEIKKFVKSNDLDINLYENVKIITSKILKGADLIFLLGFMRILEKKLIKNYKIINLHPSLLPRYKGLMTHKRMLINNEKNFGFTIHRVDSNLDSGEVISQKKQKIMIKDEMNLIQKHKKLEHKYVFTELVKYLN